MRKGFVILSLLLLATAATAQEFREERLFIGIPLGWHVAEKVEQPQQMRIVHLPEDQSLTDWREMVIEITYPQAKVDLGQYIQNVIANFGAQCLESRAEQPTFGDENGYATAMTMMECRGANPDLLPEEITLKPVEFVVIKAIQGYDALYVVQRAWHGDTDERHPLRFETAVGWVGLVRDAELCDLANRAQTCRSIGRTGGLSE